ncbi:MAG: chromate transporter [Methylococcaceae bacterium]|nr:chromate transporter [Methylococcaceae bacterium]
MPMEHPDAESKLTQVGALDVFLAFTQIALSGFGGVHFWARHVLVERRRWLTDREYVELLAMGQLLPGPNVLNLGLLLGHRFAGVPGALACIAGFIGWPFLVVIGIAVVYARVEHFPVVQQALAGMSAAAVGLLIANGLKLASVLPRRWQPWLFAAMAFSAVGLLRWPLIGVLGVLAPLAVGVAWRQKR